MELEFKITKEDIVKFNIFHLNNSPSQRKRQLILWLFPPIFFITFVIILTKLLDIIYERQSQLPISFYFAIILSMIWILFFPYLYRKMVMRNVRKVFNEGKNKSILGLQKIIIDDKGLIEKNELSEQKLNWKAIEKIADDQDYVFIYISSISAIIIPKRAFENNEQRTEFMKLINEYHLKAVSE